MSDLLVKAKSGDKLAFEELIEPIQIKLYKTARLYFFVEEEVTDIVKKTLKIVFKEIVNAKTEKDLLILGLKFLVRSCEKTAKKRMNNKKWLAKTRDEKYKSEYEAYRKESPLEEYITSLEKENRLIAILYFYDELTTKEIANILRISEKIIKKTVDDVRTKLYEMISNEGVKKYNEYV